MIPFSHDRNMKPLILENAGVGFEDIKPLVSDQLPPNNLPPRSNVPLSSVPLVASTPLPPVSSVYLSPAWNPSSRTPNPSSAFRTFSQN